MPVQAPPFCVQIELSEGCNLRCDFCGLQGIRHAGKPAPWTQDKILSTFSFCNVNREHDRVTLWIDKNIRKPHEGSSTLWFNLCVARLFNWPDPLAEIGYITEFNPVNVLRITVNIKAKGSKVFTGAYVVSTNGMVKAKDAYVVENVLAPLWANRASCPKPETALSYDCAEWAGWLRRFNGFAGFMANQVVTDMKYTHLLRDAPDVCSFVLPGPGTKRGLNRLLGHELERRWNDEHAAHTLLRVRDHLSHEPGTIVQDHFQDLNNLSNCFCEWDKYERVRLGQGRPRSLFHPHS